ncbi:hypothetical protein [uncultured Fibrella sp.]|uniref:hypothetical protein n=1 Tax=uncultured Fibrella sp. TaxID=1284596 RepID=UPI0035C954E3
MSTKLSFEVLCVDTKNATEIETEVNFLHLFMASSKIWKKPEILRNKSINDKEQSLSLHLTKIKTELEELPNNAFQINVQGGFDELEPVRRHIVSYIKKQNFDYIYVVKDDVSKEIARELYPLINEVETSLRKYLIKFFVTKLGPNWWNITADSEMKKKSDSGRKKNEKIFSESVDNKIYLIDFSDLGKMVYSQSSGYISKDEIVDKINSLEETPEAIRAFKGELQSNYNKFFKTTFKDKNFQKKWEDLEIIRHKVAHNNLFIKDDLDQGNQLAHELVDIIEEANSKIEEIEFSPDEKEAIRDNIVLDNYAYKIVTEEEFIGRLVELEAWSNQRSGGYISLGKLIKETLGTLGYDYRASNEVMHRLESKGIIEIYIHPGNEKQCIRRLLGN